jgi:hypothetical protein
VFAVPQGAQDDGGGPGTAARICLSGPSGPSWPCCLFRVRRERGSKCRCTRSWGCYVPLISYGFAGAGAWGAPVAQGAGVGGAGREQRRCGLAGASARQKMTRGLAVIPVLQRSKQRINGRRALTTPPMPHWVKSIPADWGSRYESDS